jgi:DNA-binding beta-propeller fold protein YncE
LINRPPALDLAAGSDGKFVYALNSQTNGVTIIESGDGKVLGHVAVGGGVRRVLVSPGGKIPLRAEQQGEHLD